MWIKLLHTIEFLCSFMQRGCPLPTGCLQLFLCRCRGFSDSGHTLLLEHCLSRYCGKIFDRHRCDLIIRISFITGCKAVLQFLQSRGHPALRLHQTSTLHPCLCNLFLVPPSHAPPFCSSLCVPSCTATLPRSSIERLTVRMKSLSFQPLSSSLFGSKVLLLWLRCHGPSNSTRSSVQAVAEFSTIIAASLEPLSSLSTFPSFSSLVGLQRHQLRFNLVHSSSMPPASSPAPRVSFKALTLASNASTSIRTGLSCFPLSSK